MRKLIELPRDQELPDELPDGNATADEIIKAYIVANAKEIDPNIDPEEIPSSIEDLWNWLPDHRPSYKSHLLEVLEREPSPDNHFVDEELARLGACLRANGAEVIHHASGDMSITENKKLERHRFFQQLKFHKHGTKTYPHDILSSPIPPLNVEILTMMLSVLSPPTKQKTEQMLKNEYNQLSNADPDTQDSTRYAIKSALQQLDNDLLRLIDAPRMRENIQTIYQWELQQCRPKDTELKPLFQAMTKAYAQYWIHQINVKHIDPEYNIKYPTAVLACEVMGSIRDVVLDMEGASDLPVGTHDDQVKTEQLVFWSSEDEQESSFLPNVLPWHRMWDGISPTTKSGAVSFGERIADEAFMALAPGEIIVELKVEFGVLIRAFHPNLLPPQIKSNRQKYAKWIIQGLKEVQYLGWAATINGEKGLYVPVKVPENDRFMPSIYSSDDFPVRLSVKLPISKIQGGFMVEKYARRMTGKTSAKRRDALTVSDWLINKYGTQKRKTKYGMTSYIIDPTCPVEHRDHEGYLLKSKTGQRIYDHEGRPIKRLTHPEAVKQLPRQKNSHRKHYKPLSPGDRLRALYPAGIPKKLKRSIALQRADKAFDAIATQKFIRIEKPPPEKRNDDEVAEWRDSDNEPEAWIDDDLPPGYWRPMPSQSHVDNYRALVNSIKVKRQTSRNRNKES